MQEPHSAKMFSGRFSELKILAVMMPKYRVCGGSSPSWYSRCKEAIRVRLERQLHYVIFCIPVCGYIPDIQKVDSLLIGYLGSSTTKFLAKPKHLLNLGDVVDPKMHSLLHILQKLRPCCFKTLYGPFLLCCNILDKK